MSVIFFYSNIKRQPLYDDKRGIHVAYRYTVDREREGRNSHRKEKRGPHYYQRICILHNARNSSRRHQERLGFRVRGVRLGRLYGVEATVEREKSGDLIRLYIALCFLCDLPEGACYWRH